ncbi:Uncharacterized protein OBRU01_21863, partial [Operophtera brumata]
QTNNAKDGATPSGISAERVVVSGMSGLYPQSRNIKEFSDLLYNKVRTATWLPSCQTNNAKDGATPSGISAERVVVSGMSGLYPQSRNIKEFSDLLYNKVRTATWLPSCVIID